jgi:hypothetical protein
MHIDGEWALLSPDEAVEKIGASKRSETIDASRRKDSISPSLLSEYMSENVHWHHVSMVN